MFSFLISCEKEDIISYDNVRTIKIGDGISIDNGVQIHNPNLNLKIYEDFLKYLNESDRFLVVQQKDLEKSNSNDKVIISIRHDVDDNINAAVKFAYREWKYGIKSTYNILHTAKYYGITRLGSFERNKDIVYYLETIQDNFGHEIGWHNDLVTLQLIYNIDPKRYLSTELNWLRMNGIHVSGTVAHGSGYCYQFHYTNSYFWYEDDGSNHEFFYNWEYIRKNNGNIIQIEKDHLSNYSLYDANQFSPDYFFSDTQIINGVRWNMSMVDFDTIPKGKKVVILLHPQHWD